MDKNTFGSYIREKRQEKGFTQQELADRLLIDVTAVSKWERGVTYPDITMIPEICRHLEVNEHELIASSNDTEYRETRRQAKTYGKLKNGVFIGFSAAYLTAVVTCFIVNLAVEHTLSWFFVVAAACLCAFFFVPGILRFVNKGKLTVYALTTLGGTFLLYLTCGLYTGNHWQWLAMAGTALGYFAIFWPWLFSRQKRYLPEEKYTRLRRWFMLTYAGGMFLLTVILLLCIAGYTALDLPLALSITAYGFSLPLLWGVTELLPLRRTVRLGVEFILSAGFFLRSQRVFEHPFGRGGFA